MSIFKIVGDLSEMNQTNSPANELKDASLDLSLSSNNQQDTPNLESSPLVNNQNPQTDTDGLTEVQPAKLLLMGIGGCGNNTIRRVFESGLSGIDYIAINTDVQDLRSLPNEVKKIQIGDCGLGAGGIPESARKSVTDKQAVIKEAIKPYDAIFIAAGLGGGTGSGAAPAIAQMIAESEDKLLIASVAEPFDFEGAVRAREAKKALDELKKYVDSLVVVPNEKITTIHPDLNRSAAFELSDEVLYNAIYSVTYAIQQNGVINVDFNDVRTVLKTGKCHSYIGKAQASGENRIAKVVDKALGSVTSHDLAECRASSILIILSSTPDSPIKEHQEVKECIGKKILLNENANIIFGMYDLLEGSYDSENPHVELAVIISGIEEKSADMDLVETSRQNNQGLSNPSSQAKKNQPDSVRLKKQGPLFQSQDSDSFHYPAAGTPEIIDRFTKDRLKKYSKEQFAIKRDGLAS